MKKLLVIGALLCVLCSCGSGNGRAKKVLTGTHESQAWVDLGLPSGLKWATCNVGASAPGEYGNYYAWGETVTRTNYASDCCASFCKPWGTIGGDFAHDAARANWGGRWRMPTKEEFQELVDNCTWDRTTQDGNEGYKVTGPNGQSFFLPATGFRYEETLFVSGDGGSYWSSTPFESSDRNSYGLYFHKVNISVDYDGRYVGRSVRPVLED